MFFTLPLKKEFTVERKSDNEYMQKWYDSNKESSITLYYSDNEDSIDMGIWVNNTKDPANCVFKGSVKNIDEFITALNLCFRNIEGMLEGAGIPSRV
jgi:hypothetical protein